MKKSILLPALLFSASMFAQKASYIAVSVGADIKNSIVGSAPTNFKPAFDGIAQLHIVGANVEIGMGFESFPQLKFGRTFGSIGYQLPMYVYGTDIKTTFIPSVECSMITRSVTENYTYQGKEYTETNKMGFMSVGLNLALQWKLNDSFAVQLATNVLPRPDIKYLYGNDKTIISNYFKILYTFNQN